MAMLQPFLKEFEMKKRSKSTIRVIKFALEESEKVIGKPLEDAEWPDIINYIQVEKERNNIICQKRKDKNAPVVNRKLSDGTISIRASKLRQFYRYCFDETDNPKYNKLAKKLKDFSKPERAGLDPADILLPEDVKKLINVATLERDRALVAILFESGMRIGELLSMTRRMMRIDELKNEVTFNIPNLEGCKTGSRTVVCVEICGYVQDWLKCNPSERIFAITVFGVRKILIRLFEKAGIEKPSNPHMFRHSAITHAVNIGMQQSAISMRFWGIPNSHMLATYIHLSEQMQADAYKNAKGMNGDIKVINPLASRCVVCGRLIQTGELCVTCKENKELKGETTKLKVEMETMKAMLNETRNLFNVLVKQGEKSFGFQTVDGSEAWEPETGNVIGMKNGVRTVRKPTPKDYHPDNPLLDPAAAAITPKDKKRAEKFMKKQKKLVDDLHARGGLTSTEKARKLIDEEEKKKEGET